MYTVTDHRVNRGIGNGAYRHICWFLRGSAHRTSFQVITQNYHITEHNPVLCYRRLNIRKIVTSDFRHAEAAFLIESNVLKGSIRRPNQERMPSTPAQFLL